MLWRVARLYLHWWGGTGGGSSARVGDHVSQRPDARFVLGPLCRLVDGAAVICGRRCLHVVAPCLPSWEAAILSRAVAPSIFRDKNRRFLGKSQSKTTGCRAQRTPHQHGHARVTKGAQREPDGARGRKGARKFDWRTCGGVEAGSRCETDAQYPSYGRRETRVSTAGRSLRRYRVAEVQTRGGASPRAREFECTSSAAQRRCRAHRRRRRGCPCRCRAPSWRRRTPRRWASCAAVASSPRPPPRQRRRKPRQESDAAGSAARCQCVGSIIGTPRSFLNTAHLRKLGARVALCAGEVLASEEP
eukprot:COSAG01_NODE_4844_length_4689_cov_17.318954_5_plen_303_part_00